MFLMLIFIGNGFTPLLAFVGFLINFSLESHFIPSVNHAKHICVIFFLIFYLCFFDLADLRQVLLNAVLEYRYGFKAFSSLSHLLILYMCLCIKI